MTKTRCAWAEGDALMAAYHDAEWGVPVRDPRVLWEMLILEGFQAGLSWRTILHRRDGFRAAFDGFDPAIIAGYDSAKVEALMEDPGIIRARAKIVATIGNAKALLAMRDAGEDFTAFLWGFVGGEPVTNDGIHVPASTPVSESLSKALKAKGFKFVGRRSLMRGCRRWGWSTIMRRRASGATRCEEILPCFCTGGGTR